MAFDPKNAFSSNPQPKPGLPLLQLEKINPVTVYVPNFDFLTGCREFKRCEESRRTLKIHLNCAWLSSILNTKISELQNVNDIFFLLSFDLDKIVSFCCCFNCLRPEDQEKRSTLILIEGLFLQPESIHAQIIKKGISRNGIATTIIYWYALVNSKCAHPPNLRALNLSEEVNLVPFFNISLKKYAYLDCQNEFYKEYICDTCALKDMCVICSNTTLPHSIFCIPLKNCFLPS